MTALVNWAGDGQRFVAFGGTIRAWSKLGSVVWLEIDEATFPAHKWTALTRNCPVWRITGHDGQAFEARTTAAGKRVLWTGGTHTEVVEVRAVVAA